MKRVAITSVNLSHCFALLSEQFGYSRQDKIKHVFAVQKLVLEWRNNGYVEIYDSDLIAVPSLAHRHDLNAGTVAVHQKKPVR